MRLALLFGVAACAHSVASAASPDAYQLIVHPANAAASVERAFLVEAFLKKTTRWPDGETIAPVDHRPDSAVRKAFSQGVLKRSVAAVRSYWTQRIFSGRDIPPPELDSDAKVIQYVATHPGAVGYIAPSTDAKGVKLVTLR